MKKSLLTIALILFFGGIGRFAQSQSGSFTVTWKFINIVEGYDHNNKTEVYIDGQSAGTSTVTLESVSNSVTVPVKIGSHEYRVVNLAQYEGEWEEHTAANEYSIDCMDSGEYTFTSKQKLYLLFDIDSGTTIAWGKWTKEMKEAMKAAKKKAKEAKKPAK